jgi:hypothetical protein
MSGSTSAAEKFFKAGQHVCISIDYIRQSLTVTPEYDEAARARERAQRISERKAANDQLRGVWLAQEAERMQCRNRSGTDTSDC